MKPPYRFQHRIRALVSGFALLGFLLLSAGLTADPAAAHEIRVGPGEEFSSVQAAIDAAEPGDTIIIEDGTYRETIHIPEKKHDLTIKAENRLQVKVEGLGKNPILNIDHATNIHLDGLIFAAELGGAAVAVTGAPGFEIRNGEIRGTLETTGVLIHTDGNFTVAGMLFSNLKTGVDFSGLEEGSSTAILIAGSRFAHIADVAVDGFISLDGTYTIQENTFSGDMLAGTRLAMHEDLEVKIAYLRNVHSGNQTGLSGAEALHGTVNWTIAGNEFKEGETGARISFSAEGTKAFDDNTYRANSGVGAIMRLEPGEDTAISLELTGEVYSKNEGDGSQVGLAGEGSVRIEHQFVRAEDNGGNGLKLFGELGTSGDYSHDMRNSTFLSNAKAGVQWERPLGLPGSFSGHAEFNDLRGNHSGMLMLGWEFQFSLVGNTITGNKLDGAAIQDSPVRMETNMICANGRDGVRALGEARVDAGGGAFGSPGSNLLADNGNLDMNNLSRNVAYARANDWGTLSLAIIATRTSGPIEAEDPLHPSLDCPLDRPYDPVHYYSGSPAWAPGYVDIERASMVTTSSPDGSPSLGMDLEVRSQIPTQPSDAFDSWHFIADLDGDPTTGHPGGQRPVGVFPEMRVELWAAVEFDGEDFTPALLLGPEGIGGAVSEPELFDARFDSDRTTLHLLIPVASLESRLSAIYGRAIEIDAEDVRWVAVTHHCRWQSDCDDPVSDRFPNSGFVPEQRQRGSVTILVYRDLVDRGGCDGFYSAGLDRPVANAPVTLTMPDGSQLLRRTGANGYTYFSNLELFLDQRVILQLEIPATAGAEQLVSCPNSPLLQTIEATDFGALGSAYVKFMLQNRR